MRGIDREERIPLRISSNQPTWPYSETVLFQQGCLSRSAASPIIPRNAFTREAQSRSRARDTTPIHNERRTMTTRIPWAGKETIERIAENLARRRRTVVKLPPAYHHALRLHFYKNRRYRGLIDISGDVTLLARVATVAGLSNLRALATPMRESSARVRLRSAPPQLVFDIPVHCSDRIAKDGRSTVSDRQFH